MSDMRQSGRVQEEVSMKGKKFTTAGKKLLGVLGTAVLAVIVCVLVGCSKKSSNSLYLFNWTYYTPDSVIEQFEKEFGIDVKVDSYASNEEMFAKLKAGATGYDVVFPSQDYVSIMMKENMLMEIDQAQFTNKKYISDLVLAKATYDPEMKYSVPYYMGAAGVAVNTEKVPSYEKSWSIFARTDLKGRMSMMDDMREVIGDALAYQGKSVNTLDDGELAAAKKLIIDEWKPNLVKFDAEGFGKTFAAGDFWVVQGYAEVVYGEVSPEKWNTVDFFIPKEGGPMYIDSMCILKGSKNYENAMKFINFIHRPEIYAQFLDEFRFPPSVNTGAAQYMTSTPMYQVSEMANCEIKEDVGEGLSKYNELWQDIRFTD
jgi:spermidine/putrescine transport system substrate-binding protein